MNNLFTIMKICLYLICIDIITVGGSIITLLIFGKILDRWTNADIDKISEAIELLFVILVIVIIICILALIAMALLALDIKLAQIMFE